MGRGAAQNLQTSFDGSLVELRESAWGQADHLRKLHALGVNEPTCALLHAGTVVREALGSAAVG